MQISDIWHYPVKGLGGARLKDAFLEAGKHFPGDREFAIANGHPKHDQLPAGRWMKKSFFLQLMKFDSLAELDCRFEGHVLTIHHHGRPVVSADLSDTTQTGLVDAFFAELAGDTVVGRPRLTRITEGAYTDTEAPWISLGGTASVDRFATLTGTRPDARRFRLNIMLETSDPFEEALLIGRRIRLGDAILKVVEPVGRCAAIDVDPQTAQRGPHYLPLMQQAFGHTDLGIFAEIIESGQIAEGDRIEVLP